MKYLNMTEFQRELTAAIEEQAGQLLDLREEIREAMAQGDDANLYESSPAHQATVHTLGAYRYVQDLLDKHTYDLRNSWGRYACYMEGEEPPLAPCNHLSAKAQVLAETEDRVSPPQNRVRLLALLTLATVKTFDDWLQERIEGYGRLCAAAARVAPGVDYYERGHLAAAREIAYQFWTMFGRPGFLQDDVPDWLRQAFAWSYPQDEGVTDD